MAGVLYSRHQLISVVGRLNRDEGREKEKSNHNKRNNEADDLTIIRLPCGDGDEHEKKNKVLHLFIVNRVEHIPSNRLNWIVPVGRRDYLPIRI